MKANKKNINIVCLEEKTKFCQVFQRSIINDDYTLLVADSELKANKLFEEQKIDILIVFALSIRLETIKFLNDISANYNPFILVITSKINKYASHNIWCNEKCFFMKEPVDILTIKIKISQISKNILKDINEFSIQNDEVVYDDFYDHEIMDARAKYNNLKKSFFETIKRLTISAERYSYDAENRIKRLCKYAQLFAKKLAFSNEEAEKLQNATPLYDIGKVGIWNGILQKTGKLTKDEFNVVKSHTTIGASILLHSKSATINAASEIAISHHEKWDSTGYPYGLGKKNIPLNGRIIAIMDVFEALTSPRPYKEPYPDKIALNIINKERKMSFDPDLVDVFMDNIDEFLEIKEECNKQKKEDFPVFFQFSDRDKEYKFGYLSKPEPIRSLV